MRRLLKEKGLDVAETCRPVVFLEVESPEELQEELFIFASTVNLFNVVIVHSSKVKKKEYVVKSWISRKLRNSTILRSLCWHRRNFMKLSRAWVLSVRPFSLLRGKIVFLGKFGKFKDLVLLRWLNSS